MPVRAQPVRAVPARLIRSTRRDTRAYTFEWWNGESWTEDRLDARAYARTEAETLRSELVGRAEETRFSHVLEPV